MNEKKKSVFFDKRDENYIHLTSPIYFLEMFTKKKIKCDVIIPQTIIFSKGTATLWLFNSKTSLTPLILKKNSNKLNFVEICRVLCRVKQNEDFRIDTLTTLLDIIKAGKNEISAFARISKAKKAITKVDLVKMFLDGNVSGLQILQEHLENYSKADELFYVEYRQDVINLPVSYRFFKKSTQKQVILQPLQKKLSQLHIQQQTQHSDSYDESNKNDQVEYVDCMFKFFDNQMNQTLSKIVKKIVDFLEKAYKVRVKKLVAKFMQNDQQMIYFLGLKELLVDFQENAPYEIQSMKNELKDNSSFENFLILIKMFTRLRDKKPMKIPQTIYEDDKEISQKLYKNLIVQRCVGDFCDYIMEEKNRGPLQIRKNIVTDYKKYFGNKKMNEEKFSVTLPHEISFQLILRTRECSQEVIEVLMKNKIFTRNSKHHFQEFDKINTDEEYPFKFNKTEVYNLPNLYKTVKICKNCFVVYSLASKYFDQRLSNDLQQKQWIKRDSSSLAQQKTSLNASNQQLSQLERSNIKRNDSRIRQDQNQSLQKIKTQASQNNAEKDQSENRVRKIQSAKQFRVIQSAHSQAPKTFKLFMPSQQPQLENTKRNSSSSKTNNIDINRLTMGFLNYTKPPKPNKIQSAKQQSGRLQSQRSQMESQHLKRSDSQSDQFQRNRINKSQRQLNSNRQSFFQGKLRVIEVPQTQYSLLDVCQLYDLEYPPESVPDIFLESVNYFCFEQCAIPYLILQHQEEDQEFNKDNQSGLDLTEKEHQIVIFLGDFFDNSFEYLDIMQQNIKPNTTILLMNLPGQSYTVFDPNIIQDNLDISLLLDSLLFELCQKDIIKNNDIYKFIGYGYGGFQVLSYMAHVQSNLPRIGGLLIINAFCEIDDMLTDTLKKSKEVFQTCPNDMPELGFHFWNSLIQSHEEKQDPRYNPISLNGRLHIINGLIKSQNVWNSCGQEIPIKLYHGLKNCVVNIKQAHLIKNSSSSSNSCEMNLINFGHKLQNLEELLFEFL
ncbi:unnamed protein product (macronuclear) [Paramecium tetraurelia]|uniref:Uncharacterized protein n=1 Tax=Paramecium tetraurelia TaxID=5888 RepID=A0BIG4_PARTE|nr:uncharacterized protein GSPATT00004703001 [Paramecium tetraurelia]CAK58331.1 unnamed protein product [Paramecium tetraurelia]|eukprot:XP_001425729.1 hypothetical protein (macronuclear) [Paramecium tetraurelia strain d4-2]